MDDKQKRHHSFEKKADVRSGNTDRRAPRSDFHRASDGRRPAEGRRSEDRYRGADRRRPKSDHQPVRPQGPSARDVALLAFRDVARSGAYAAQALDRRLRDVQLTEADRRLTASIFYFTVENWLRIENLILARVKSRPEPEIMEIMDVAAAQLLFMDRVPPSAAVNEGVKLCGKAGCKRASGLVNSVLAI